MNLIVPSITVFVSRLLAQFERRRGTEAGTVFAEQVVTLPMNGTFQLERPYGCRIECRLGSIWITQYGDCKDIVVKAGSRLVVNRDLPMFIQALEPTEFRIGMAP